MPEGPEVRACQKCLVRASLMDSVVGEVREDLDESDASTYRHLTIFRYIREILRDTELGDERTFSTLFGSEEIELDPTIVFTDTTSSLGYNDRYSQTHEERLRAIRHLASPESSWTFSSPQYHFPSDVSNPTSMNGLFRESWSIRVDFTTVNENGDYVVDASNHFGNLNRHIIQEWMTDVVNIANRFFQLDDYLGPPPLYPPVEQFEGLLEEEVPQCNNEQQCYELCNVQLGSHRKRRSPTSIVEKRGPSPTMNDDVHSIQEYQDIIFGICSLYNFTMDASDLR